jgi:proline iminopeptidase
MRRAARNAGVVLLAVLLAAGCIRQAEKKEGELWPPIEPYETGHLEVSDIHGIYYELSGNPDGIPVFVLHGGPGAATVPYYRRFFDPEKFHIVMHDQRGCGNSKPFLELEGNTTWDLVEDIEKLREHVGAEKILLFGGSWGSTLGLAYGITYPGNVAGMILRGIFTATQREFDHYYCGGSAYFFPEAFRSLQAVMPAASPCIDPEYIYRKILEGDEEEKKRFAIAWVEYEGGIAYMKPREIDGEQWWSTERGRSVLLSLGVIENYYMANRCFLEEGELLDRAHVLDGVPITLVNGRYDVICPPYFAMEVHERLPGSKLIIAEGSGHSMGEPEIEKALLNTVRDFEQRR